MVGSVVNDAVYSADEGGPGLVVEDDDDGGGGKGRQVVVQGPALLRSREQ